MNLRCEDTSVLSSAAPDSKTRLIVALPHIALGHGGGLVGGYVNSAINALEAMQSSCTVTLIAGVRDCDSALEGKVRSRLSSVQVTLLRMRSRPATGRYFVEFLYRLTGCCRVMRSGQRTLVLGHSGHPGYAVATLHASRILAARSVHMLYCPVSESFHERQTGLVDRWIARFGLERVDHLAAISENVARTIRRFSKRASPIHVIRPAIPDNMIARAPLSRTGTATGSIQWVAGFVGHHKPEKGFDLALSAVRALRRSGVSIRLLALMSGAHPDSESGRGPRTMIESYGLAEHVDLIRGVSDIRTFYSQLDILFVPFRGTRGPSDYPMVLLEGLSRGIPSVCTPVGAIPEVVQHGVNGFVARDISSDAYSETASEALTAMGTRRDQISMSALVSAEDFRATRIGTQTLAYISALSARSNLDQPPNSARG